MVVDTADAITHPRRTITGLGNLVAGMGAKIGIGDADPSSADALVEFYANRYGSLEAFQEAFRTDPAGVISDIGGVFAGGAGAVAKGAGLASNSARMAKLSKWAGNVSEVAAALDPITGTAKAAGGLAKAVAKSGAPEAIMKAVTKPNVSDPKTFSKTLLDEKIPISNRGVDVLNGRASGINTQIDDILAETSTNVPPPLANQVYRPSDAFVNKYLDPASSTNVNKTIKVVRSVSDDFPKQFDSVKDVQAFKKNLYGGINWRSDKFKDKVRYDYLRDVASNSRAVIEDAAKDSGFGDAIHELNVREGLLLEARKPLEKTIHRVTNRNPIGLTSMLSGLGGAAAYGDPVVGGLMGLGTQALFNPRMGARYAQKAYDFGKKAPTKMLGPRAGAGLLRAPEMAEQEPGWEDY
ncbi:hypothetical protein DRQ25_18495 [Candidatus Fermentibacteria bacterium]|nr:MAG: hypothetical protein DRQ25_18495 [Candidatus Fermentibacteria bacterium]